MTPPKKFHAAVDVRSAWLLDSQPPFIKRGKLTGRFAQGVRYEREVQEYLSTLALGRIDIRYLASPWIEFWDKSGKRWCQPDAILVQPAAHLGIIIEVKYQHTEQAYFQLRHLYTPVVEKLFPDIQFGLVEIVHWHDNLTIFPEPYDFTPDPFSVRRADRISVHIYNPKRERVFEAGCGSSKGGHEEDGSLRLQKGAD